jgi:hypothetical protein
MSRDTLLKEQQVVEFFDNHIPRRTLQYWRQMRLGPPWTRLGRHVLYRVGDLQDFVEAGVVETLLPKAGKAARES